MATARQRFARSLVVDLQQLIAAMFDDSVRPDIGEYIQRGDMNWARKTPMPAMPEVDAKIAEIQANGGKLKVD